MSKMGIIKTKGLVLKAKSSSDSDKMITILTPDLGKIACIAKDSKAPKSKLMSGTQFLCFGEFIVYKSISSYRLNSCEPIEIFYDIRLDYNKLEYASKISRILVDVTEENIYCEDILKLALNTIYIISKTDGDLDFIMAVFKIRLLEILGLGPTLNECNTCGEKGNIYFSVKDDSVKCEDCARLDKSALLINKSVLIALKFITKIELKKLFSFNISDENKIKIKLIAKLIFEKNMDKQYN